MKHSRNVHFVGGRDRLASVPVSVPSDNKARVTKGRRGSVHWQHPEIPTTITEGHVLLETDQKKPSRSVSCSPGESGTLVSLGENDSDDPAPVIIARDRSHSLPSNTQQPNRLLRDRNWFIHLRYRNFNIYNIGRLV